MGFWLFAFLLLPCVTALADPVELRAETWLNHLSLRLPEDRTSVLYFFVTFQKEDVDTLVARLNKANKREDTVVIGLTPQGAETVEPYVEKHKIDFAVGARSSSYRDFKVKRFPQVVVIEPPRKGEPPEVVVLSDGSFDRWLGPIDEAVAEADGPSDAEIGETMPTDALRTVAHRSASRKELGAALGHLRTRLPIEEFTELCASLAQEHGGDPFLRAEVAYRQQQADPSRVAKEPRFAPSVEAYHAYRSDPAAAKWEPVRDFAEAMGDRAVEDLSRDYYAYLGDSPGELLIRRKIISALGSRARDEPAVRDRLREDLKDMLLSESDFANRLRVAWTFADVCEPGDFETASFLEAQLATEPNVRHVRPALEYVVRYLRTGEE